MHQSSDIVVHIQEGVSINIYFLIYIGRGRDMSPANIAPFERNPFE